MLDEPQQGRVWHELDPATFTLPKYSTHSGPAGAPPKHLVSQWRLASAAAQVGGEVDGAIPDTQARQPVQQMETELMAACAAGNLKAVASLLAASAEVNARDGAGNTALDLAVHHGQFVAADMLAAAGAVLSRAPEGMAQMLINAIKVNLANLARLLASAGADINATDMNGRTPLHHAVLGLRHQLLPVLANGRTVAHADFQGNTPLHLAAVSGNTLAIAALLDWQAALEARNRDGNTALSCACAQPGVNAVILLLRANADISVENQFGQRPLHIACQSGRLEAARLLLARGADVHCATGYGDTPMSLAQRSNHAAIAGLLALAGATS